MELVPDEITIADLGAFKLNATVVVTWALMALLTLISWLATRKISDAPRIPWLQNVMESLLETVLSQISGMVSTEPRRYLPLVGTLFIFLAVANFLTIIPGYPPPTGSLHTAAALSLCVFLAVPLYGITGQGLGRYLSTYIKPNPLMLPFNILGELSRTLALAVRLFGNVMSGSMLVGILLAIAPFLFPAVMQVLGLLTGLIQAYIFAILALVYVTAGGETHQRRAHKLDNPDPHQARPAE